jgi:hypothetical protein
MGSDAGNSAAALFFSPDGKPLTLHDLPSSWAVKWTARRKAAVIHAVHTGLLSLDEASARYALSSEEFRSWEVMLDGFGLPALASRRIQHARPSKRNIFVHYH